MFGIKGHRRMSVGLEPVHNGYIQAAGSPGSPPASLAEMISRNKMLEGKG